MEFPPFVDLFPIGKGGFPIAMLVYRRVTAVLFFSALPSLKKGRFEDADPKTVTFGDKMWKTNREVICCWKSPEMFLSICFLMQKYQNDSELNMFSFSSYKILICTTTNPRKQTHHHVPLFPGVWEKAGGLLAYCQFLLSSLGYAWFVQNPSWQQWMWHRINTSGRNTRSEGCVCAATWLEDQPS